LDPMHYLGQLAQGKQQLDLGLDKDKAPSDQDIQKLQSTFQWMQECSKRVTGAQNIIDDRQITSNLEKNTKAKGWPQTWLDEFKKDPDGARESAQQMIDLAQKTENYGLALSELGKASGGKFPQVLPPGTTTDKNGELHFDFPQSLKQRDPANQKKIDDLHRWFSDEGVKIDQALTQYKIADASPEKIVFFGDSELPAGYKALLEKNTNRLLAVVNQTDLQGKDGCKALVDKDNQLITLSSAAEVEAKQGKLEEGQRYVDFNVADTNLIAARFKVRTQKNPNTGEDKIIVSQSLQAEHGELWNYENIGVAKIGKPKVFDGNTEQYKNEKVYKPDDFVPVLTGVGMKLVPAKELEDFRSNQQIWYYGMKAGVAAMDATMVVGLAIGVGEEYFAGRLATRRAMITIAKEAAVAGSGICNSAAGRANPITNNIEKMRLFYFNRHLAMSVGGGTAMWLGREIERTATNSNVAQNLLRKIVGDRRIVPYIADNYDPATAPSLKSIFDNGPKEMDFEHISRPRKGQNTTGSELAVVHHTTASVTRIDTMTKAEDILPKIRSVNSKIATAAMAGLAASVVKVVQESNEARKSRIHGDPLVNASKEAGEGQGIQPLLEKTMKKGQLSGSKESDSPQGNSEGPNQKDSKQNESNLKGSNQNDSNQSDDRSQKIDALNAIELTIGDGEGKTIIEEAKKKLSNKDASNEEIERFKSSLASKLVLDGDTLARSVNFNVMPESEGKKIKEEAEKRLQNGDTSGAETEKKKRDLDSFDRTIDLKVLSQKKIGILNNPDDRTALSPSVQRFLNDRPKIDSDTKIGAEAALIALSDIKDGQVPTDPNSANAKPLASVNVEVPTRLDPDCPKVTLNETVDTERVIIDLKEHLLKSRSPVESMKTADALLKMGVISELEYGATMESVLKDPNCSGKNKVEVLLGTTVTPFVQVIEDQRRREQADANQPEPLRSLMQGQSYGADSRGLVQTLKDVAASDKDSDVRATCIALLSTMDSNNDAYIHKVFNAYQQKWQNSPDGTWSDFVMRTNVILRDLPIQTVPEDVDAEQKLLSLSIAKDTRAIQIRSAKATLSMAGESNPEIKQSAIQTYADAAGAFDVVDSVKIYDLENTKLALQELNQGTFKELAQSDPDQARDIVEKSLVMLNSPLNEKGAGQAAEMLAEVTKLVESTDASSRQQYVTTLENMLDGADAGANCAQLRVAAIKNLATLNSTSSIEVIRAHCTSLPTITVNGKEEKAGESDAIVRQTAIQALVQLKDPGLSAMLDLPEETGFEKNKLENTKPENTKIVNTKLEENEPDIAVRNTLRDLRIANNHHFTPSQTPDPIFSERYKDLEEFSKDTQAMSYFLSGEFSKVLAKQPEQLTAESLGRGNYASPKEVADWKKDELEQWEKLSQLASRGDVDGAGGWLHGINSRADQAKIVLYEMIQGKISPSLQNNECLADQDWHVQEKAAQALAKACEIGAGNRNLSTSLIENCLSNPESLSPQAQSELLAAWQKLCAEESADGQNVIPTERALRVYDSYQVALRADSKWMHQEVEELTEKLFMLNNQNEGVWQFEPQSSYDQKDADSLLKTIDSKDAVVRKAVADRYEQRYHHSLSTDIEAKFGRDSEVCKRTRALFE
jgi:hypothetical protein